MSLFGWSYPPGCSGPPEEIEFPCAICGHMPEDCTCPECGECSSQGCIEHLKSWDLANLIRNLEYRLSELHKEAKKRESTTLPCPVCGKAHTIDIFREDPIWCCNQEYWSDGWREVFNGYQ